MIPKIIHYCWFGPKPYPKLVKKCVETWHCHLPDYEFMLWNESNSPMDVPFVQEAYSAKKYAFVSDYVRFWALYNHGGLYLDTDMYVLKSFNDLLNNDNFFAWETPNEDYIGCCAIGSLPQSHFIKEILEFYQYQKFTLDKIDQFVVPHVVTPIFKQSAISSNTVILPYDYFYPFPFDDRDNTTSFLKYASSNTYAIHLWNLSWVSGFLKFIMILKSNFKKRI